MLWFLSPLSIENLMVVHGWSSHAVPDLNFCFLYNKCFPNHSGFLSWVPGAHFLPVPSGQSI